MAHNTDDINIIKLKSVSNEIELGMIRSILMTTTYHIY